MSEDRTPRYREIVAAARDLLERGGADALTMRAVAGALGIKAPSLYKHLPDKDALELAIVVDGFTEAAEVFEAGEPLTGLRVGYYNDIHRNPSQIQRNAE